MYLYQVDQAVTYTSEDLILFRDSPFAAWMERLTLENPDHGIPPDRGSESPQNSMTRQDDIAATLREEGKDVLLVDWDAPEPQRRSATLGAMRSGVDFIVNGHLALGPLSGSANLLMRTSGYSDLGNYLYIPCDTQAKTTLHSAFRLCFLADLLHSLQGQLPPQMLIIRGGDLVPLRTEDHIYHYQAVKHRFMDAMRQFRKHRMPDPSESAQFGRWSECAREVMRQRALNRREEEWQATEEQPQEHQQEVPVAAVGEAAVARSTPSRSNTTRRTLVPGAAPGSSVAAPGGQVPIGPTLAEQARMLAPFTPAPGASEPHADTSGGNFSPARNRDTSFQRAGAPGLSLETALDNLEFIGRSRNRPPVARRVNSPEELKETLEQAARSKIEPEPAPTPESSLVDSDEVDFLPLEIDQQVLGVEEVRREPAAESGQEPQFMETAVNAEYDRDEPGSLGSLPLPEVEEIGLDGTLLCSDWLESVGASTEYGEGETSGPTFSDAPPPALGPSSRWMRGADDAESGTETVVTHPTDRGILSDSDELPGDGMRNVSQPASEEREAERPAEGSTPPMRLIPFSDSLITSEDYDD